MQSMEQQFLSKNPTRKKRMQEKGKLIPLDFSAEAIVLLLLLLESCVGNRIGKFFKRSKTPHRATLPLPPPTPSCHSLAPAISSFCQPVAAPDDHTRGLSDLHRCHQFVIPSKQRKIWCARSRGFPDSLERKKTRMASSSFSTFRKTSPEP